MIARFAFFSLGLACLLAWSTATAAQPATFLSTASSVEEQPQKKGDGKPGAKGDNKDGKKPGGPQGFKGKGSFKGKGFGPGGFKGPFGKGDFKKGDFKKGEPKKDDAKGEPGEKLDRATIKAKYEYYKKLYEQSEKQESASKVDARIERLIHELEALRDEVRGKRK
jgi:hypothetical protein